MMMMVWGNDYGYPGGVLRNTLRFFQVWFGGMVLFWLFGFPIMIFEEMVMLCTINAMIAVWLLTLTNLLQPRVRGFDVFMYLLITAALAAWLSSPVYLLDWNLMWLTFPFPTLAAVFMLSFFHALYMMI